MTRDYELGFILNPEVNEEQTRTILARIEQIVTNYGGQVMRVNQWGRRRLAYQIEHYRDGLYVFIDMTLTPETVSELDRTLKVSEEVLRHLITRRDPKIVQKEREAQANAAAQAAAEPEAAAPTEEATSAEEVQESSAEEGASTTEVSSAPAEEATSTEEVPEVPASAEEEAPAAVSTEESEYAPPAIAEEATHS